MWISRKRWEALESHIETANREMGEVQKWMETLGPRVDSLERAQLRMAVELSNNSKLVWAVFGVIVLGFAGFVVKELLGG